MGKSHLPSRWVVPRRKLILEPSGGCTCGYHKRVGIENSNDDHDTVGSARILNRTGIRSSQPMFLWLQMILEDSSPERLRTTNTTVKLTSIPVISGIQRAIVSYFADSLYSERNLESALKLVFSEDMRMSNCSYDKAIGIKIVITATTIKDCEPCIFTNYWGYRRPLSCGKDMSSILYGHKADEQEIVSSNLNKGYEEATVWEMYVCVATFFSDANTYRARCTSAAPW